MPKTSCLTTTISRLSANGIFPLERVTIIEMGNVMIDIARFLLRLWKNVEEVLVVARRGPRTLVT